jgi:hypothetical protein
MPEIDKTVSPVTSAVSLFCTIVPNYAKVGNDEFLQGLIKPDLQLIIAGITSGHIYLGIR